MERKFSMDLSPSPVSSLHEYNEKCARYVKLGRINEIISVAESLLWKSAGREGV